MAIGGVVAQGGSGNGRMDFRVHLGKKRVQDLLRKTGVLDPLPKTIRGGGGEMPQYGRYAVGYTPSVLKKINAIIGRYCIEDQVDPYAAIQRIRGSLSNIGLSFDEVQEFTESNGNLSELFASIIFI